MVKSEIKTQDGTIISIEGSEEEVTRIISKLSAPKIDLQKKEERKSRPSKQSSKASIADMLMELKEERFFDKPKSLSEIKHALAERGMIYPVTTLSPSVLRLVRNHSLGRIKVNSKWAYVKR